MTSPQRSQDPICPNNGRIRSVPHILRPRTSTARLNTLGHNRSVSSLSSRKHGEGTSSTCHLFTYGHLMDKQELEWSGRVKVLSSKPAFIQGFSLCFNLKGSMPFVSRTQAHLVMCHGPQQATGVPCNHRAASTLDSSASKRKLCHLDPVEEGDCESVETCSENDDVINKTENDDGFKIMAANSAKGCRGNPGKGELPAAGGSRDDRDLVSTTYGIVHELSKKHMQSLIQVVNETECYSFIPVKCFTLVCSQPSERNSEIDKDSDQSSSLSADIEHDKNSCGSHIRRRRPRSTDTKSEGQTEPTCSARHSDHKDLLQQSTDNDADDSNMHYYFSPKEFIRMEPALVIVGTPTNIWCPAVCDNSETLSTVSSGNNTELSTPSPTSDPTEIGISGDEHNHRRQVECPLPSHGYVKHMSRILESYRDMPTDYKQIVEAQPVFYPARPLWHKVVSLSWTWCSRLLTLIHMEQVAYSLMHCLWMFDRRNSHSSENEDIPPSS
eukprot:GHVQ01037385.1.p1 GENE.GHVQ01037385.1~~GHVQ01037385.1.p1  ORF type:complete len:497 (+),score=34.33 GHVQ01037385.1:242-1732(+)